MITRKNAGAPSSAPIAGMYIRAFFWPAFSHLFVVVVCQLPTASKRSLLLSHSTTDRQPNKWKPTTVGGCCATCDSMVDGLYHTDLPTPAVAAAYIQVHSWLDLRGVRIKSFWRVRDHDIMFFFFFKACPPSIHDTTRDRSQAATRPEYL